MQIIQRGLRHLPQLLQTLIPPCCLQRLLKQSNQQQAQIDKLLKSTDKDTKISTLQREVDKLTNSIGSCNRALDTCRGEKQRQVRQTLQALLQQPE